MPDEVMTMNAIRAILSDEVRRLREGETTAANVNAICNATGKILSSVKLEMEYHKLLGKTPHIPMFLAVEPEPAVRSIGRPA